MCRNDVTWNEAMQESLTPRVSNDERVFPQWHWCEHQISTGQHFPRFSPETQRQRIIEHVAAHIPHCLSELFHWLQTVRNSNKLKPHTFIWRFVSINRGSAAGVNQTRSAQRSTAQRSRHDTYNHLKGASPSQQQGTSHDPPYSNITSAAFTTLLNHCLFQDTFLMLFCLDLQLRKPIVEKMGRDGLIGSSSVFWLQSSWFPAGESRNPGDDAHNSSSHAVNQGFSRCVREIQRWDEDTEPEKTEALPEAADIMWSEQEGKCGASAEPLRPEHLQQRDEGQQERHLEALGDLTATSSSYWTSTLDSVDCVVSASLLEKNCFMSSSLEEIFALQSALMIRSSMKTQEFLTGTYTDVYIRQHWLLH